MLVNKDYFDRILCYYPNWSHAIKNLKNKVLLDTQQPGSQKVYLIDSSPAVRRAETSITVMRQKLEKTAVLFPNDKDQGLQSLSWNATPEQ